jgi:hypothetical protein
MKNADTILVGKPENLDVGGWMILKLALNK